MADILILAVEDEPEVRDALERDLSEFAGVFALEMADDAEEASTVVAEYLDAGTSLGLVLADHVLPGVTGVDLLVSLHQSPDTTKAKKILITGQASHADTIRAINEANLSFYIAKPWDPENLCRAVREALTAYVIETVDNVLPYVGVLDGAALMDVVRTRLSDR